MFKFKPNTRSLVFMAMLIACEIVLSRFLSINTSGAKLGFGFVPLALSGMCLGPVPAAIVGGLSDFLGAMLFPIGPYHPGFTVVAMGFGLVYGILLYNPERLHKNGLYLRITAAAVFNCIVLGLFINTLWVSQLYGSKTYLGWFVYRIPEYLIGVPLRIAVISTIKPLSTMLTKTLKKQ